MIGDGEGWFEGINQYNPEGVKVTDRRLGTPPPRDPRRTPDIFDDVPEVGEEPGVDIFDGPTGDDAIPWLRETGQVDLDPDIFDDVPEVSVEPGEDIFDDVPQLDLTEDFKEPSPEEKARLLAELQADASSEEPRMDPQFAADFEPPKDEAKMKELLAEEPEQERRIDPKYEADFEPDAATKAKLLAELEAEGPPEEPRMDPQFAADFEPPKDEV